MWTNDEPMQQSKPRRQGYEPTFVAIARAERVAFATAGGQGRWHQVLQKTAFTANEYYFLHKFLLRLQAICSTVSLRYVPSLTRAYTVLTGQFHLLLSAATHHSATSYAKEDRPCVHNIRELTASSTLVYRP